MWENVCELFKKISDWGENNFWLALCVAIIAFMQWRTSEKQRKQDLFDKRFEFYNKSKNIYFSMPEKKKAGLNPYLEAEDLFPLTSEALWLFGEDMVKVLSDLVGTELEEDDRCFNNLPEHVENIFNKYMKVD